MAYDLSLIGLALLACLSPLLTFARLWQIKEWRWDRLREHRKEEGLEATFVSRLRVGIAGGCIILFLLTVLLSRAGYLPILTTNGLRYWTLTLPGALALLTLAQIALRRQPLPVWTAKAKLLVGLCLLIDALLLLAVLLPVEHTNEFGTFTTYAFQWVAWVLPYLQPLIVMIAWALLRPIDLHLKNRVFRHAMSARAAHAGATVIGITGSVGKTTTKELIAHVLRAGKKKILVTPAHVNTEMGVAQWLSANLPGITDEQTMLVVEMGAYRAGEIALLCRIAKPDWGVLTHIGTQHVGLFGSPEKLRDAKAELIEALPESGRAFLNGDNAGCREVAKRARCPAVLVGTGGHLDLEAFDIEETPTGIRFQCESVLFDVPLHGTHNVTNVLLAIAVGRAAGLAVETMAATLRSFTPPSKTFDVRRERGVTILDDTHNASEASLAAAIAWAATQSATRKILVTPGLIEMGALSADAHARLGTLATASFDEAVFTNAKTMRQFARGFAKTTTLLSQKTPRVEAGTLLVCVGRMPASVIERLLPRA